MSVHSNLRAGLRRTVRHLPPSAQLWLKRADAAIRQSDWAGPVGDVRRREQAWIAETVGAARAVPNRERILFLALQTSPPWTEIEGSLASALSLRGHDVRGVLCDGLLPVCEMNLGAQERPACATCVGWRVRYYEEAFGFSWPRLSDYLCPGDRDEAEALVDRLAPNECTDLRVDGVTVGAFALRELQRYRRGFVFEPTSDPVFRQWLVSGTLFVRLMARLIARDRPAIVIASSGRTLQAACATSVARDHGVRVVTWDTEPSFSDGLVLSHTAPAVEVPLDDEWPAAARRTLTSDERERLTQYLGRWAASDGTPFPYNPFPVSDRGAVADRLRLRPGAPLVVAFTNSAWDMAVVNRDVGFPNAFGWLFSLVEYARRRPEIDLVVRAHPAETNVPADLQSRTPVPAEIRRRAAPVPDNVRIVEGDSPISSYTLALMAQVSMVYSSRIGLEIALAGRRPWVAGAVTYRGKGFTRDLGSKDEMFAWLDARMFDERLSDEERARAERFAYFWFFRYVTRLPVLRPRDGRFRLSSFRVLAPGGDPVLGRLCQAITAGTPFIDLDERRCLR